MSSTTLIVLITVIAADALFLPLIFYAVINGTWAPFVSPYPPREPGEDAVEKQFQSYRIGLVSLGGMIHTTVDDTCLHLRPAAFGRLLGMKAASIPWEEITPDRRIGKRYASVKIGTTTVAGPRWALELAFADHPADPDNHTAS